METRESKQLHEATVSAGSFCYAISELCDSAVDWVGERSATLLRKLEESLFEIAVNATCSAEQNELFETMNTLRAAHNELLDGIARELRQQLCAALDVDTAWSAAADPGADETDLLERAVQSQQQSLCMLNQQLNRMLARPRFEDAADSIVAPTVLLRCVERALADLRLPALAAKALREHASSELFVDIDELCARLGNVLSDAGVDAASAQDGRQAGSESAALERSLRERIQARNGVEQTRMLCEKLWATISQDARMSAHARTLLEPLRGLLLHTALRDANFLADTQHPLRVFITEVSALIAGWEPEGNDALCPLLGSTLARLEDALPELDTEALDEFSQCAAVLAHRARVCERRSEQAERSRALQLSARAAIDGAFARYLDDGRLPSAAEELLGEGWRRVMTLAYLRGGVRGTQWRQALRTLGEFAALWHNGATSVPVALAETLREGMTQAGLDPLRSEILLQGMEEDLASWDPPARLPIAQVQLCDATETESQTDERAPNAFVTPECGTWFRFAARAARGKFIACLADPERLLFVDRDGMRFDCVPIEQFARMLADGSVQPLEQRELIEAGLAAALRDLQPPAAQVKRKCSGANAW